MQNEQCGICWNLKFDKNGNKTHVFDNQPHEFSPMDYCVKCKKPKYDQFGLLTHQNTSRGTKTDNKMIKNHKFVSGREHNDNRKHKRKRKIFFFTGLVLTGVVSFIGFSEFFF